MSLIKARTAESVIAKHRIVMHGSSDGAVSQATGATSKISGVADLGAVAVGDSVDVVLSGFKPVQYGGNVTRGDRLTSDADGKAITANPSAGSNVTVIGQADVSGVDNDICDVFINIQQIQG